MNIQSTRNPFLMALVLFLGMTFLGQAQAQDPVFNQLIDETLNRIEEVSEKYDDTIETSNYSNGERFARSADLIRIQSLNVEAMALPDVFDIFAEQTPLQILKDEAIEGRVTVYLEDLDPLDALRVVLEPLDLAYKEEEENVVRVMTGADFENEFGYVFNAIYQTKIVPLEFTDGKILVEELYKIKGDDGQVYYYSRSNSILMIASEENISLMSAYIDKMDLSVETLEVSLEYKSLEDIVPAIEPMLSEDLGVLDVDEENLKIILTDTKTNLEEIQNVIADLDQPEREVQLKRTILQIVLNDEHPDGVDWEAIVSNYSELPAKEAVTGQLGFTDISAGTLSSEDLVVLTEALEAVGEVYTLSEKEFTTGNTQVFPLNVFSADLTSLSEEGMVQNTFEEQFRILLKPDCKRDKTIVSNVMMTSEKIKDVNWADLPSFVIEPGSSLVLGGVFKNTYVTSTRKIPLLGDLPFLGFAFRNEGRREKKTELIIFLTMESFEKEKRDAVVDN